MVVKVRVVDPGSVVVSLTIETTAKELQAFAEQIETSKIKETWPGYRFLAAIKSAIHKACQELAVQTDASR